MELFIFIILGILIACVCEGLTLSHEIDRANRQKRWSDEHKEESKEKV